MVNYTVVAAESADVWVTWADTSAAEQQLGVRASISLDQGLCELVHWYMSDAEWRQHL